MTLCLLSELATGWKYFLIRQNRLATLFSAQLGCGQEELLLLLKLCRYIFLDRRVMRIQQLGCNIGLRQFLVEGCILRHKPWFVQRPLRPVALIPSDVTSD